MSNGLSTREQFEVQWQAAKVTPVQRGEDTSVQEATNYDYSLLGILDQFLVLEGKWQSQGKISKADHDDLVAKVNALKAALEKIKERDLSAAETAERFRTAATARSRR
jgi:hypothetical protein